MVAEGYARFLKAPDMICKSDLAAIRLTTDNLDPNLRAFDQANT